MHPWLRAVQERKLDRIAAAYAVAGWLLVQGASIAFPLFGAPNWALRTLIAVAIAGFPLVLGVVWVAVPPPRPRRSHAHAQAKQTDATLIALLGAVAVLSVAQLAYEFLIAPRTDGLLRAGGTDMLGAAGNLAPPPSEPSIAVLPFINMSGEPSREYFSDGVSEELLNDLSNVPNLRVAARTSSFAFKGKNEDIREIARALNVRAILEGSVRENGPRIRITAQLINAADGYHVWSQTYDRDLSDILSVQDDIARAITASLTHRLLSDNVDRALRKPVTVNPDVYQKYLEALAQCRLSSDAGDARAVALLKDVTARQPDFAPAFSALGGAYVHMAELHGNAADRVAAAEAALNEALALDPNNLQALSWQLALKVEEWDWDTATDDARRLISINPHSLATLDGLEFYYGAFGFYDQQIEVMREALARDPLSFVNFNNLAFTLVSRVQKYDDAAAAASASLRLQHDRPLALYSLCLADAGLGKVNEARGLAERLSQLHETSASDACALRIATASGHTREALRLANKIAQAFPAFVFDETNVGSFFASGGDLKTSIAWYERGYDRRNSGLFATQFARTTPKALLETAGWKALMQRPLAIEWRAERDRLALELAERPEH